VLPFTLMIPAQWICRTDPVVPSLPLDAHSSEERVRGSGARNRIGVLLVEDDDGDALLVEELLSRGSLDVGLVRRRTVREALSELPGDIDCVLLDLGLPDGFGVETVHRVRAVAPRIAVIVLTGLDNEGAGEAAVDAGAQDYLVKGRVEAGLLTRAIRYAVGRRHAENIQQQLQVAEIQAEENSRLERGLVPHPIISDRSIWIASSYVPGRSRALLGGDFFDAVETPDGLLHVMVGDVSGHGPDEAALGAGLRIAWRALTLSGAPADHVLRTLHLVTEHERQDPGTFATLCALEICAETRTLSQWRAGHPAPVLVAGDSITSLPLAGGGPPIGTFPTDEWAETRFDLPEDWSLLLYTDGITEGGLGNGSDRLGDDGLRRLIADYLKREPDWRSDPHGLLAQLIIDAEELNGRELTDDVAMLLVGARSPTPGG
jgi:serine phosphatase RsbU (regulator of sigma subunit)